MAAKKKVTEIMLYKYREREVLLWHYMNQAKII